MTLEEQIKYFDSDAWRVDERTMPVDSEDLQHYFEHSSELLFVRNKDIGYLAIKYLADILSLPEGEIISKLRAMLISKGDDYANNKDVVCVFRNAAMFASAGGRCRISDETVADVMIAIKIQRIQNIIKKIKHGKGINFEPLEDSLFDLAGYCFLFECIKLDNSICAF